MRLATDEEYRHYWNIGKVWYYSRYNRLDNYQVIGAVAEFLANMDRISLYNQSLR